MMKNLTTVEITGLIVLLVAILTISGSLYTYLVHNAKLKKQEYELQKYQIKKNVEEELLKKQAHLKIEKNQIAKNYYSILIINDGLCDANDLEIDIQENPDFYFKKNKLSKKLMKPGEQETFELNHIYGNNSKLILNFTWDDEFQNGNKYSAELTLN